MSKSSSQIIALLAVALLAACQGVPQPAPQPEPVIVAQPQLPAPSAAEAAVPAVAEPIDVNQQRYQQALATLKSGDADRALALLLTLSEDAPDKPYLFTNLGLAYFRLQRAELAEQAFTEAVARNPNDAVAHNHLGILLRRKGQFQDALAQYQRAIEIDADYAGAHLNLGILFDLYLQDLDKALQQYQKYRSLTDAQSAQVDGWIVDIERRLKSADTKSQG
jgi:Flp pilus assembly protein TadD